MAMRTLLFLSAFFILPAIAADESVNAGEASAEQSAVQPSEWMSSAEFDSYRISQNEHLRFPDTIEGRLLDGELQYRGVFKGFLPSMNYYYSHWGLTDDWYAKDLKKYAAEGYQLRSHTVFENDSGASIHQATWIMTDAIPVLGWEAIIIPIFIWLAIPVYFSLQLYTLRNYAGAWRFSSVLPAIGLVGAIGYTLVGFTLMQNLPALPLLWFSPGALAWLLAVMVLRSLTVRRETEALI